MLGFIEKELLQIRSNLKTIFVILILYGLLAFEGNNIFSFLPPFISVMLLMGNSSYDGVNNWDSYAISLPNGRKNVVRAKYISALIVVLAIVLLVLMFGGIVYLIKPDSLSLKEMVLSTLLSGLAALILFCFCYPLVFKYGIEKARIALFVVIMALVLGSVFIFGFIAKVIPEVLLNFIIKYIWIIGCGVIALIIWGSYLLSMKIYSKREF